MSETAQLKIQYRSKCGKGANRKLREKGIVPGIFYSFDGENIPVQVEQLPLSRVFGEVGMSQIVELAIERDGKTTTKPALIKALVQHPVKRMYTHVDFFGLDMSHDVVVSVPVRLVGKSQGEVTGGVLQLFRETLELRCKPANIPEAVEVDVTNLQLNENLLIEELALPEGTEAIYEEVFAVVGLVLPNASSDDEESEDGEAEAEAESSES